MSKLTIFLYCVPIGILRQGDVMGYALAEDGRGLASHLSSGAGWAQHDMGLLSDWKHDSYQAASFPFGYQLEWVDDLDAHRDFQAAFALNQEKAQVGSPEDGQ